MSTPGVLKLRSAVRATAIAAVVASGAWYGAGLKTEKEVKQVSLLSSGLIRAKLIWCRWLRNEEKLLPPNR